MSKITVTTIAGQTSGGDANTVKIESGDAFNVVSGDLVVDTSTLKVDSSNNKVGIGTASPSHPLHLVTSTDGTGVSGDDVWAAVIQNAEATDARSYGLKIMAGSTTDQAFAITDHDGSNDLMAVDGYGHITMPKQSAFSATKSAHQLNYSGGTNTVTFNTEIFDQNGDFTNNTFTAPVTGRYQLSFHLYLDGITAASDWYQADLVTSNRTYYLAFDPDFGQNQTYWHLNASILADMDANDTAYINLGTHSSASGTNDINLNSWFTGFLAC